MADYYPLIAKAVASLPESSLETRSAIYERARSALITQLNKLDPPVAAEVIEREEKSLASAVDRLEAELEPKPEKTFPQEDKSFFPVKVEVEAHSSAKEILAPDLKDQPSRPTMDTPLEEQSEGKENGSQSTPWALQLPKFSGSSTGPSVTDAGLLTEPPRKPILKNPANAIPSVNNLASGPEAAKTEALDAPVQPLPPPAISNHADSAPQSSGEEGTKPSLPLPQISLRAEVQRPFAPQPKGEALPPKRLWILGFVVCILVAVVGGAAWYLRDRPENLLRPAKIAAPVSSDVSSRGKISDRLEGGRSPDVKSPQTANEIEAQQTASAPQTENASGPLETLTAAKGAAATNGLELSQHRAALLIEAPDDPAKVKTMTGSVQWRLDNVTNAPDQPLSAAVHADIDIPEAKFQASMTFQKNFDPSLPASHTIKITFVQEPGSNVSAVQQISLPQMRRQDAATGETLNGVPVPIVENSFLIGLSRGTAEPNNLNLIQSHEWMDFPMLLANGRIAKLTFEKGPQGSSAIDDAITSWAAQP